MTQITSYTLLIALILCCPLPLEAATPPAQTPYVVFANPGPRGDAFFQPLADFMQAAADDLGIKLKIYYGGRNHIIQEENMHALFTHTPLPDYVITTDSLNRGLPLLKHALKLGVKVVLINETFIGEERKVSGEPREKFPNWVFELIPDDENAGYLLAQTLIGYAKDRASYPSKTLEMFAIKGHPVSGASILREKGLQRALAKHPDIVLKQSVNASWRREKAAELTEGVLQRFPDISIIWSASDVMAAGAEEELLKLGIKPNQDVVIGGVDWTEEGLNRVKNGELTASVGGHFMDGGWAMVMLYDFIHGVDQPATTTTPFSVVTEKNINRYCKHFGSGDWSRIDFKKFSRHLNPKLKRYDFSLQAILRQLR